MATSRTERSYLLRVAEALRSSTFDSKELRLRTRRDTQYSASYYRELALLLNPQFPSLALDVLEPLATIDNHDCRELFETIAIRAGLSERAVAVARRVLDTAPGDLDAEYHLGLALSASGNESAALESFTKLRAAHPEDFGAWRDCLVSLNILKRSDELAQLGLEALHRFIDTPHREDLLAAIAISENVAAIREAGDLLLERHQDDATRKLAYRALCTAYRDEGDRTHALQYFDEFARLENDENAKLHIKAALLEQLGDLDDAFGLFSDFLARNPKDDHFRLHCGVLAARQQRWNEAERFFRGINTEGDFGAARSRNLAALYMGRRQYDLALEQIDSALALQDFDWRLAVARAQALKRLGRIEEAQRAIDGARKLDVSENDLSIITTQAEILTGRRELRQAEQLLREALKKDQTEAWLRYNLGFVHLQQGLPDAAKQSFQDALGLQDDLTFRLAIGYCEVASGRAEVARQLAIGLCDEAPDDWRSWHLLALATLDVAAAVDSSLYDDVRQAIETSLKQLISTPRDEYRKTCEADLERMRAQCAVETEEYAAAMRSLRRSLEIDRDLGRTNAVTKINLRRLQRISSRSRAQVAPQIGIVLSAIACEGIASVFLGRHLLNASTFATISIGSLAAAVVGMALPTISRIKVPGVEFERAGSTVTAALTLESSSALSFSAHALDVQVITPLLGYDLRRPESVPASTVQVVALPASSLSNASDS